MVAVAELGNGVLVVTPTFNEADNLFDFAMGVHEVAPAAHLLVVDDNSPDGTGDLADALCAEHDWIHVMHRAGKMGLGSAYLDGFRWALQRSYRFVFEMDTDLSHDPRYLPKMIHALGTDSDLVVGSRNISGGGVKGWGPGRHLLSRGGSLYSRAILGLGIRDLTSGYKGFDRRVLEAIDLDAVHSEGYSFQVELTYRATRRGFRVREIPIVFVDRRVGQSKMSRGIVLEALYTVWKLRWDALTGRF